MNGDMPEKAPLDKNRIIILALGAVLLIETIFVIINLLSTSGIRAKAKLNDEQIRAEVQAQVDAFKAEQQKLINEQVQQQLNEPYKDYTARDFFGAFSFKHPKFYYVFTKDSASDTDQLRIFIDSNPIVETSGQPFYAPLRVVIRNRSYAEVLKDLENDNQFRSFDKMKEQDATVSGISGKKFTGKPDPNRDPETIFIVLPYRDKTMFIIADDYKQKLPSGKTREQLFEELLPTFNLRK